MRKFVTLSFASLLLVLTGCQDTSTTAPLAVDPAFHVLGGGGHGFAEFDMREDFEPDTVFVPFHFSGWWQGEDMLEHYPEGSAPIIRGDAVNTAWTYGYDIVTMMQETKRRCAKLTGLNARWEKLASGVRPGTSTAQEERRHGKNEVSV